MTIFLEYGYCSPVLIRKFRWHSSAFVAD